MLPTRRKSASLTVLCVLLSVGLFALSPASLQGQYFPVGVTGPSSNRVDMVFMGDGYTSDQIPTTYWNDVQTLWTYLFGPQPPPIAPFPPPAPPPPINFDLYERDPYVQYRRFFNTWRIDVVSAESGADNGSQLPQPRNTALNAGYGYGGGPQRFLYIDLDLGRSVLAQNLAGAPFTAEVPVVAVNDTLYGGGGGLFGYGPFAVYAAGDAFARQVALHELGHSFNGLGDEYDSPGAYTGPEPAAVNLSTDQTGAKWAPWLGYQDVPAVGVIGTNQGGLGSYTTGIWRPSVDSKMRNLGYWSSSPGYPNSVYGVPFNAVCREKIILDIYSLVRPLDAWSPNAAPVIDPQNPLSVTVVDPAVIQVAWSIDGAPVASGGSFQIQNIIGQYGAGRYTVTARAYDADPNNWVTRNRQLLEQSVNWSVQLSGASTSRWAVATDGQWSLGDNWAGGVPNGVDAAASFLDTPAAPARTITVDVPLTVGILNFDNANAYTLVGAPTITMQATGGPAIINVASGSHTISPPVFLASNTNVNVWSGTLTLPGTVSGPGGLTKTGTGTLVLSNSSANLYGGTTTVAAGVLRANFGAGLSPTSNLTLAGGVLEGLGVTFTPGLGVGAGQVQWTGSGGFSAFDGLMTVNIGGNPTPQTLTWGVGGFVPSGSALVFGSSTANNQTLFLNLVDLNGGTETVTVLDNPNTSADFATLAGVLSNGGLTKGGPGTLVLAVANNYTGPTTVNAGTLAYGVANAINPGSAVTVNGGTFDIGLYPATVGTVTLNGGSIVGGTAAGLVSTASYEVRSGTITAVLGGPAPLNKADPYGTVVLATGANTYTGPTTIYGGALQAWGVGGAGLPATSNLTLAGGVLEGTGNVTFSRSLGQGPNQVQWTYSGGFSASGGVMTVNIGGNPTPDILTWGVGNFVPTTGGLVFGSLTAANETRFLNPIDLADGVRTVTVNDNPDTNTDFATLAGVLSNGGLTKDGPGRLVLTAANTYGGLTTIDGGGTLQANSGAGLPTDSNLVFIDGVLQGVRAVTFIRGLGIGRDQVQWMVRGGFSAYGGLMTVNIGGSSTPNTLTWNVGSFVPDFCELIFGSDTADNETRFLNPIDLNRRTRTVRVNDNPSTSADFATLVGRLSNGGLAKEGTGTLTLSGANTYTGPTTVNAGTLQAGIASVANTSGAFGNNSAVTLANTAGVSIDLNGFDTQIGSLTGGGAAGGNVALGAKTLTVGGDNTNRAAYAGVISGTSGSITKIGTGTLTLSGVNTYTGGTTVSEGTLLVENTAGSGTGTGAVTVGAATLSGTGFINGPVILTGDSTLIGGTPTSTGTLTLSNTLTIRGDANQLPSGTVLTGGNVTIDLGAVFIINGTLGGEIGTLIVYGTLLGKGTIGKAVSIEAGGTISPGAPSTILTVGQVLAAETPQNFSFEIGAPTPDYTNPASSVNDVLRLTSETLPFANATGDAPAGLTADTVIDVYFLFNDPPGGEYKAEFFAGTDYSEAIADATFQYWRLDPRGQRLHNSNFFSPLDGSLVDWSVVPETATFDGAPASGYITAFTVVPEPATLGLLALGGLGALLLRRK
ncbi:MAG: autotransporter-associated beta strand repeat-containing protein [Planctomycetota bacterium]|nr:autotransporter-associated beta strand repeat-containing protein [Planctomycetota bacterium]